MSKPEIALGSAQFGLNYGITNESGQTQEDEVKTILKLAMTAGIRYLDTAPAYGNAEEVIGRTLPQPNSFKIISKLPAQNDNTFDVRSANQWQHSLETSLQHLKIDQLDSLLLHSAKDLTRTNSNRLLDWLLDIRRKSLVKRVGVSIYNEEDLEGLPLEQIQLVQLPCSLYDQRLVENGTIQKLIDRDIDIHARSIYLQGMIVTPSSEWPKNTNPAFLNHHKRLEKHAAQKESNLVELALGWAKKQNWLEATVIGVTKTTELSALIEAWKKPQPWDRGETSHWKWRQTKDLDPRQWKSEK